LRLNRVRFRRSNPSWIVLTAPGGFELMRSSPFLDESREGPSRYTNLFARISEDDDGYTLQVRLYHCKEPSNAAWGEELTDSLETASSLIAALVAEFSITTERVKIEIRMQRLADGTRH
jgi:hypothetical protein